MPAHAEITKRGTRIFTKKEFKTVDISIQKNKNTHIYLPKCMRLLMYRSQTALVQI